MQVLEFHFNPSIKDDLVFDSFCYEPENIYERRLGSLYMIGELKNALPQNFRLLEKIASVIKKENYYKFQRLNELALKEALKQTNEFLSNEVSKENTNWLGNLNFAIISLKNYDLNFTKVGTIKIFLLRGPHIIDIGSKLDLQEIEPYPLKIFSNIVSGKLAENDIILALTNEIFPVFKEIINEITKIFPFDEKKLRDILNTKNKELSNVSGACLILVLTKAPSVRKKPKIIFQKELEKFSFKEALSPITNIFLKAGLFLKRIPASVVTLKPKLKFSFHLPKPKPKPEKAVPVKTPVVPLKVKVQVKTHEPKISIPKISFNIPKIKIPQVPHISFKKPQLKFTGIFKKQLILILLFAVILTIGFFVFQREEQQKLKEYRMTLEIIQTKVNQAESFLILKDVNPEALTKANSLFSEAWNEIQPLTKIDSSIKNEVSALEGVIENNLGQLNNLTKIDEPELIFEFDAQQFIPQKIVFDGRNLYFYSPYSQNLLKISDNEGKIIRTDQKFNAATILADSILFFTKPDKLVYLQNDQLSETFHLRTPYPDFNFNYLTSFKENLYFLDSGKGEIIRYPAPISEGKDNPQNWLFRNTQKPVGGKSIAVDGSIWILNKDNSLSRYYGGSLQETINLNIFPKPKNFTKIYISPILPYLYLLEPAQNRLVILDKKGGVVEQFQSEKFDNLLDFAVSENGKTIFLLNSLRLYKVEF